MPRTPRDLLWSAVAHAEAAEVLWRACVDAITEAADHELSRRLWQLSDKYACLAEDSWRMRQVLLGEARKRGTPPEKVTT